MSVVRQWMISTFRGRLPLGSLAVFVAMATLVACNPTEITGSNSRSHLTNNDGSLDNKAYVYKESPTLLAGPYYGPSNPNMANFLDRSPAHITNNTTLTGNCLFNGEAVGGCLVSLSNEDNVQALPRNADRTYIFPTGSKEFYQVNALYHLQKGIDTFFEKLEFAYSILYDPVINEDCEKPFFRTCQPRSMPPYIANARMFWFRGVKDYNPTSQLFQNTYLNSFAQCKIDGNASFSPAGPELCFGGHEKYPGFYFVQDPSVVYHELGHALVSIMMNMRNATDLSDPHDFRSNLGSFGYDEAGAINEGIADYFSFVINGRKHVGEWALGRTAQQSRPLSEDDPLHIPGIELTSEGRLSYPQYLLYDPNFPDSPLEDVHYAGQITTHYLVALTEALKNTCGSSDDDGGHNRATSYVFLALSETLSELGDLNAKGVDNYYGRAPYLNNNVFFNNLDKDSSYIWAQINNPPTYRKFYQVFAKNIYRHITGKLCSSFTKSASEKLLDDYGLLLFKHYNDNGNSTKDPNVFYRDVNFDIPLQPLTPVNENNRRKSVLVSKQLLRLAERNEDTPDAISYYIIDNRTEVKNLLQELLFKGLPIPLSTLVASTDYNNGNIRVSPGEVVALIPNLHNDSNSTMAGVQILANDWDHVHITDKKTGNFKPCVLDNVTTADQGGETGESCVADYPDKTYQRLVEGAAGFPENAAAPVCLVQLEEGEITRWVSQNEFRKKNGLSLLDKDCLGYSTSGTVDPDFTFNPHECLVRFLPGANEAFFSKIDPQQNYFDSVVVKSERKEFNTGNLLLLEVNKWIPPGTKFRCRLRARFSNCSDCYTDPDSPIKDDFIDAEYNGHRPFKIINLEFDVND